MRRPEFQNLFRVSGLNQHISCGKRKDGRPTVRDEALVFDKFENTRVTSTMTTTSRGRCTVQNVLDTEVDFVSSCVTGNFDAISERRQSSVCPTTSTIL
jgi:hypothetical protein